MDGRTDEWAELGDGHDGAGGEVLGGGMRGSQELEAFFWMAAVMTRTAGEAAERRHGNVSLKQASQIPWCPASRPK